MNYDARSIYSSKPVSDKLYLVRSGDYIKIGIAHDVAYRVRSIQTGNPMPVFIEAVYNLDDALGLETVFHHLYRHKRSSGEWFRLSQDEIMNIGRICKIYMSLHKNKRPAYVAELMTKYKKERRGLSYGKAK